MTDRWAPEAIVRALDAPTPDRRPTMRHIRDDARARDIAAAIPLASVPLTRQLLCDLAGYRYAKSAVPALLAVLDDPDAGVRGAAYDALGKIYWKHKRTRVPDEVVGGALVRRWEREPHQGMRRTLAGTLGVVSFPPGWRLLIEALDDNDSLLRRMAAWGLWNAHPTDAEGPLREAVARETDPDAAKAMRAALDAITKRR